jgi:hypothetical protein
MAFCLRVATFFACRAARLVLSKNKIVHGAQR